MAVIKGSDSHSEVFIVLRLFKQWESSIWQLSYWDVSICFIINIVCSAVMHILPETMQITVKHLFANFADLRHLAVLDFILGVMVLFCFYRWWLCWRLLPSLHGDYYMLESLLTGDNLRELRLQTYRCLILSTATAFKPVSQHMSDRLSFEPKASNVRSPSEITRQDFQNLNDDEAIKKSLGYLIADGEIASMDANPNHKQDWLAPLESLCRGVLAKKVAGCFGDVYLIQVGRVMEALREKIETLLFYNTVEMPSVLSQVCTLALVSFYVGELMHVQINKEVQVIFVYLPIIVLIQVAIYRGLFGVCKGTWNPLQESSMDAELVNMFDDNLTMTSEICIGDDKFYPPYLQNEGDFKNKFSFPETGPYTIHYYTQVAEDKMSI